MRYLLLFFVWLLTFQKAIAAGDTSAYILKAPTGNIYGTLKLGVSIRKNGNPVVLIIAGSGPTDRDGNTMITVNNAYRALADSLSRHGISSLRYDKRGIGASKSAAPGGEERLRFGMYIDDAAGFLNMLRSDHRFGKIFVIGHSEGSLIGICAEHRVPVDGLISIAGAGAPADSIIMQQLRALRRLPPALIDSSELYFKQMRSGIPLKNVPKALYQIFRPTVQPYMVSWLKYDPAVEITRVTAPILILQGDNDLQVDTTSARVLAAARPDAKLVIIEGMNHIMREAPKDPQRNIGTYNNPGLPIHKELVAQVVTFVKNMK